VQALPFETLGVLFDLATDIGGVVTAEVWVVDRANNSSNRLSSELTVHGSGELDSLSLSSGSFDQLFDSETMHYSAKVGFLTSSIVILFERADASALINVNDQQLAASENSTRVSLHEGDNIIRVDVAAMDSESNLSYSIEIARDPIQNFSQHSYIKESSSSGITRFGQSVTMDGNTLAIGMAQDGSAATGINGNEADESAPYAGAVTVFARDGAGIWSRNAYIKASNTDSNDAFGWSAAMDGNTLVVGAINEDSAATGIDGDQADDSATDSGAVYIFVRDEAGLWSQQAYIKASNSQAGDHFGGSIAIDGDTLAVGALREDGSARGINGDQSDNGATDSGAVYVFVRGEDQTWSQQAYLKASNTDSEDLFGIVALAENTLAVGAYGEDSAATGINGDQSNNSAFGRDPITDQLDFRGCGAGAVYIFARGTDDTWSHEAYVKASNAEAGDCFGISVAMSGETLAVGADQEKSVANSVNGDQFEPDTHLFTGAAYVFIVDEDRSWSQQAYIKNSQTQVSEAFGRRLGLVGDTLAVSAPAECSVSNGINSVRMSGSHPDWCADPVLVAGEGAVYVFARDITAIWSQKAYVKASNNVVTDANSTQLFGSKLALSSETLAVVASGECGISTGINGDQRQDCVAAQHRGAVYVFH